MNNRGFIGQGLNRLFFVVVFIIVSIYIITKLISNTYDTDSRKANEEEKKPVKKVARTVKLEVPELVKKTRKSIVVVLAMDKEGKSIGQGTGFFCKEGGWIVTNYHVIDKAEKIAVKGYFGKHDIEFVYDIDKNNDLALLKLEVKGNWPWLPIASKNPSAGEKIVVIGSPLGLTNTVSDGIISSIRDMKRYSGVLQVTSPISPGSSGSPVMNMYGEVVGVATFQLDIGQNLNFAIPAGRIRNLKTEKKSRVDEKKEILAKDVLDMAEGPLEKGKAYLDAAVYRKAAKIFKGITEKEPDNAEAFYYLGMSLKGMKDVSAVDAFKKSLELKPDYVESYFELGKTYIVLNMNEDAVEALKKALKIRPWFYEPKEELGKVYFLMGKYKSASKILEEAVEYSDSPEPFTILGLAYAAQEKHGKAIRYFKNALKIKPDYMRAHTALGYTFVAVQNWTAGIKAMNKAVLVSPSNPVVHYLLGVMHLGNKNLQSVNYEISVLKSIQRDKDKIFSKENKKTAGKLRYDLEKLKNRATQKRRRRRY